MRPSIAVTLFHWLYVEAFGPRYLAQVRVQLPRIQRLQQAVDRLLAGEVGPVRQLRSHALVCLREDIAERNRSQPLVKCQASEHVLHRADGVFGGCLAPRLWS